MLRWLFGIGMIYVMGLHQCSRPDIVREIERQDSSIRSSVTDTTLTYLYLGHAYDFHSWGRRIDPRLEVLDYGKYDKVILGGDVISEALLWRQNVRYLDSIFDLSDPDVHYVLGNHDARNGNLDWYSRATRRPSYYTGSENGLVVVILNTTLNVANCEELDAQYRMLKAVCDTISEASHLMILHHHAIATNAPGISDNWSYSNWPYYYWDANCFAEDPSYLASIYPLLLQVHARGIQVINVSGDMGFHRKTFEEISDDGIVYLASGIDNSRYFNDSAKLATVAKDSVLLFTHRPAQRQLSWQFHDLDSLWQAHLNAQ